MNKCGRCHEEIAKNLLRHLPRQGEPTGLHENRQVLRLPRRPTTFSRSRIPSPDSAGKTWWQTCQKCHPGATRRFAGYLTHATHHDPKKYPFLYWTFWGMTSLLLGTFVLGGLHTLLWLPRALQMRRQQRRETPKTTTRRERGHRGNRLAGHQGKHE